ncbi:hypothetical protein GQR58_007653 [Nymphon striatum]|nr:hypothetical protein GQR58_007653 [Nymphon striatum]
MLGMLQRNEADLALGPFQMTKDRGEDFSFSQAVHSTQLNTWLGYHNTWLKKMSKNIKITLLAADTVLISTYMDDSMDSVETELKYIALYRQLSTVWKVAGMHARKWITNSREVLKEIPKEGQLSNFSLDKDRLPILNTLAVCAIRIRIRIRRCFREEASGADAYQIHKKESTSINVCGENAEPERLLFIFWCGCSFITMSFYRTVLLSHLTVPKYAKSMESLADLAFNDIPTLIEKDGSTYTTLKVIAKLLIKIHFLGLKRDVSTLALYNTKQNLDSLWKCNDVVK